MGNIGSFEQSPLSTRDQVTRVASLLEQQIVSGDLEPGDRLPAERTVCTQMGVSRSVVREAYSRLASLGLVESQQGSGTRVATPNSKHLAVGYRRMVQLGAFSLKELNLVRLPLETAIASLAAAGRTDDDLARMEKSQKILGSDRRSLKAQIEADVEFHAALADATGSQLFQVILAPIQELLIESRRQTLGRYGTKLAHTHHAKILAAVHAQHPTDAANAMTEHMQANLQHLAEISQPSLQTHIALTHLRHTDS